jgi:teichuronic acid biosynthesis glycosyltransferase TuaC
MPTDNALRVLVLTPEWPSDTHPSAGTFLADQVCTLEAGGVLVDVMAFRGRASIGRYWRTIVALRQRIRIQDYDIVHAHFGQAGFIAVMQRSLPVVVTFHGSDVYGLPLTSLSSIAKSYLLRLASWVAAYRATEVIAVSARLADRIPRANVYVIPMAVSLHFQPRDRAQCRASLGWMEEELNVLFVGDPNNEIKRFALASNAVERLRLERQKVRLRVCWNEAVDRVAIYMNAADVLLITSLHEGGPLVVSEALRCNLPVVSVDVGIVRERLNGVDGCVVCPDDKPETIANGLRKVLAVRQRLAGPQVSQTSPEDVAARVTHVYRQAISRRKGTRLP